MTPQIPASDSLLTYGEAAAYLGIKVGTLYSLVHHRRICHLRFGRRFVRFHRRELDAWIAQHTIAAMDRRAVDSASMHTAAPHAAEIKGD